MNSAPILPKSKKRNSENTWGALLAGQVLHESLSIERLSSTNQSCVERLRHWLTTIVTEQAPFDSAQGTLTPFPATERALAGNILNKVDDPRPGVGVFSPLEGGRGVVFPSREGQGVGFRTAGYRVV